jgi:hypothetical protein
LHVSLRILWKNVHINLNSQKCKKKKTKNINYKMQKNNLEFCAMITPHVIFECPLSLWNCGKGVSTWLKNVQEQASM